MNSFEIIVDSGLNIPEYLVEENHIQVVSFTITVNGEERLCYQKGVPFDEIAKRFYDDMRAGAEAKTSLIPEAAFIEAATPALQAGKDVFFITISSGISGTYDQANAAAKTLEKQFKGRKIYAIDSANASMGSGLLALKLARLRDMGQSAESCYQWLQENIYKINSYFTVADLKYLRKTGRISATVAIAGTLLNIKPILRADDGLHAKIASVGKERGRKKALEALAKSFEERAADPENQTIAIMHADSEQDAQYLANLLRQRGAKDIVIGYYDICTGSHVGPGTVALFFVGKDRRPAFAASGKKTAEIAVPSPVK